MKICAYVQRRYAKENYKNECMDTRLFIGLRVIIDALRRDGYDVDWAGIDTVNRYDVVLVSLTSDCDWWTYIAERLKWPKGDYKVIVGGAGVLHVAPFLPFADYFSLGRGEKAIPNLIRALDGREHDPDDSIITADTFSPDNIYHIRQADDPYPHEIETDGNKPFKEETIGCNHKCLFCGYTWHRRFMSPYNYYKMTDSSFGNIGDKERAMLDIERDPESVDFRRLRTTALDGMSQRLRYMVNKRISHRTLVGFLTTMADSAEAIPHEIKLYNILGYPTETDDDYREFYTALIDADDGRQRQDKQWKIMLHSTPFRAMPGTPLACAPMSLREYRGLMSKVLGGGETGHVIYRGNAMWCVCSGYEESLASLMLSVICHRGGVGDADNVAKVASSRKFWAADKNTRVAALDRLFDMQRLAGEYTPDTLPSRYLRTYCSIEKAWERPPWREPWVIRPPQEVIQA